MLRFFLRRVDLYGVMFLVLGPGRERRSASSEALVRPRVQTADCVAAFFAVGVRMHLRGGEEGCCGKLVDRGYVW